MYFESFEELQEGTVFFQERTFAGLVKFVVESKRMVNGEPIINVLSESISGYGFECTEEIFTGCKELGKYFYKTKELGQAHRNELDNEMQQEIYDKYKHDKDEFLKYVASIAYTYCMDGYNGDYVRGLAIKELAHLYYPDFDLDDEHG